MSYTAVRFESDRCCAGHLDDGEAPHGVTSRPWPPVSLGVFVVVYVEPGLSGQPWYNVHWFPKGAASTTESVAAKTPREALALWVSRRPENQPHPVDPQRAPDEAEAIVDRKQKEIVGAVGALDVSCAGMTRASGGVFWVVPPRFGTIPGWDDPLAPDAPVSKAAPPDTLHVARDNSLGYRQRALDELIEAFPGWRISLVAGSGYLFCVELPGPDYRCKVGPRSAVAEYMSTVNAARE